MIDIVQLEDDIRTTCERFPWSESSLPNPVYDADCAEYVASYLLVYDVQTMNYHILRLMLGVITKQWDENTSNTVSKRLVELFALDDPESGDRNLKDSLREGFKPLLQQARTLVLSWLLWRGENLPAQIWKETWNIAVKSWS